MNSVKRLEHSSHSYARLVKIQQWMTWLTVPIALLGIGAAVVFGLLTSTGHVTW
jgi:hypothetical protein